ncbi:hypothetical protein GP486_000009 [Trichoglossum hirsutum]|uniref:Nucleoporin NUP49/NSP49 n=1 Tax=Trichoglossum hirsutum TaxID=265104 RepID=A0A9P8LJF2_9PEZI|nr:hypothetical protein GP486_000009 [Trichoglossum hirsutum]
MSFARSGSGPGGLTINTAGANSLFASSTASQPQTSGGLFGSSTQTSQPASSLLGTSTATSQPQQPSGSLLGSQPGQAGGLFGSSTTQSGQAGSLFSSSTTQPGQTGGLFGSTTTQSGQAGGPFGSSTTQPGQAGGLFGSTTTQPGQGGGLFGASSTQPQQSSNLFGGSSTQQQPQQSGGLFGGSLQNKPSILYRAPTTQQNQTSRPSLFTGLSTATNTTTTQQQPQRTSLFGATTASQPTSLFPSSQQPAQSGAGMFGSSLGGSSIGGGLLGGGLGSTLQQQSVPGVKIDLANLRGTTRFGDLHEDLQKLVEEIDKGIVAQTELHKQVEAMMPGHEQNLICIPNDVEFVSRRLTTMQHALENDAQAIDYVRKTVKRDANDARLSFRALDNLKLPPQYHYQGLWSSPTPSAPPRSVAGAAVTDEEGSTDLVAYFSQQADVMAETLEKYKCNLQEIEEGLRGVEAKTVQLTQKLMLTKGEDGRERNEAETVNELSQVLRGFETGILNVAGSVWMAREGVQGLTVSGGRSGGRDRRRIGVY